MQTGCTRPANCLTALAIAIFGCVEGCPAAQHQRAGAGSQPSKPPDQRGSPSAGDGRTGKGRGIIVKVSQNIRVNEADFEKAKANPYVTGVQVLFTWAQLEPRKGGFDWEPVDRVLKQCEAADKQVVFSFAAASGKLPTPGQLRRGKKRVGSDEEFNNRATPAWLFEDSQVRRVGGDDTPSGKMPLYPVFWDPAYQRRLGEFIAAFARRYDGHPRIEFIRMGGWQIETNEPSFYGGATPLLREQLEREGERLGDRRKPKLTADSQYAKAVINMVDIWCAHFKKTRLAATIHFSDDPRTFEFVMNEHCAERRCVLLNTGLNEGDKTDARKFFRKARAKYNCKTGWGGITHLGSKRPRGEESLLPSGLRREAMHQAVGSDKDAQLAPASLVSYVVVGTDFLEDAAFAKWIADHLAE